MSDAARLVRQILDRLTKGYPRATDAQLHTLLEREAQADDALQGAVFERTGRFVSQLDLSEKHGRGPQSQTDRVSALQ
jgi:hypothetical protein